MSVSVKYKETEIASMSETGTKTLLTSGKYCDADIVVENTKDSGGEPTTTVEPGDITFYDYDGTVVAAWTLAELAKKTELPTLPNHEGLTCQGWNWTLDSLKSYNQETDIGAMYITDDEKTRIYVHFEEGRTSPMLGCCPNGTVSVDWGDGTDPETLTGTSVSAVKWTSTHNYTAPGSYVITLTIDGNVGFIGQTTANQYACILRYASGADGRNIYYLNCITKIEFGAGVSLGDRALMYCSGIRSITMPSGLAMTGAVLFQNCVSLRFLTIPANVTGIRNDAFRSCSTLRAVSVTYGTIAIQSSAFLSNILLRRMSLLPNIRIIYSNAFYQCQSLTKMKIPKAVGSIQASAFANAYGMKIYDFSEHTAVPTLANTNAFTGMSSDCEIRVPSALADEWKNATNWTTYTDHIVGV